MLEVTRVVDSAEHLATVLSSATETIQRRKDSLQHDGLMMKPLTLYPVVPIAVLTVEQPLHGPLKVLDSACSY